MFRSFSRAHGALRVTSALGTVLLASVSIRAEAPAPVRLTLTQALQRALDQNPRVHMSLLALAESGHDRSSAASALMPQVSAQALNQRNKYNLDALMGMPQPHGPTVVGPFTWTQTALEAQVSLFDLSLWRRWRASVQAEDSARAQHRAVREEVAALVVGQYLGALRAAAAVKASESRVVLGTALVELAENQQKQGVGTRLDTLRAQLQLQTERQRLIQARMRRWRSPPPPFRTPTSRASRSGRS